MSKTQPICTHCPIRSLFSPSFSLTSTLLSKEPAIRGRSPSTQQPNRARSRFVPFPQPIVDHHHARGVSTALTTFRPPQSSPNGARERTCLRLLLLSLSARSAQLISVTVIKSLLGSFERVCARFVIVCWLCGECQAPRSKVAATAATIPNLDLFWFGECETLWWPLSQGLLCV